MGLEQEYRVSSDLISLNVLGEIGAFGFDEGSRGYE